MCCEKTLFLVTVWIHLPRIEVCDGVLQVKCGEELRAIVNRVEGQVVKIMRVK